MTRRQAREAVFELLFETEFGGERTPEHLLFDNFLAACEKCR
jgi:transcription termination factor NusB